MKSIHTVIKRSLLAIVVLLMFPFCEGNKSTINEDELIAEYLEKNEITTAPLDEGLYVLKQRTGIGKEITANSEVEVHYTGYLMADLSIFDTTYPDTPFSFSMNDGDNIEGWIKGFYGLREGDSVQLIMHSKWAYGSNSYGTIPAFSTIIFDVVIISVK